MTAPPVSYQLLIRVEVPIRVRVGALGTFDFAPGRYLYTGSARRNLAARIARHRRSDKKLRWHIDYLLAHPRVRLLAVETAATPECRWNQSVHGTIPVAGFGASDCRRGCSAHLKFLS